MRILFYTGCKPCATKGGTEHATISVARALSRFGWECFSCYSIDEDAPIEPCFADSAMVSDVAEPGEVARLVNGWHVDVAISQWSVPFCRTFRAEGLVEVPLVYVLHCEPGKESWAAPFGLSQRVGELKDADCAMALLKGFAKVLLNPLLNGRTRRILRSEYRDSLALSDRVVVLSDRYVSPYLLLAGSKDASKIEAIPNPLSFDWFAGTHDIAAKERRVLIVSRMAEAQKRLSVALDVWAIVASDPRSEGWSIDVIGEGPDLRSYREKVVREGIPMVTFHGRREPMECYLRSSLFLMTSISEGWPLTLMEAQQSGVVPVAFDSFGAAKDIVNDGETGLLFPFGDVSAMAEGLLSLMADRERRERMALAAVKSSRRFSSEVIGETWYDLLVGLAGHE